jgi:hypothetical protein
MNLHRGDECRYLFTALNFNILNIIVLNIVKTIFHTLKKIDCPLISTILGGFQPELDIRSESTGRRDSVHYDEHFCGCRLTIQKR